MKGLPMRKRLLVLATALAFACSLAPAAAFASTAAVVIEIGADGAPVEPLGEGWTHEDGELVLEAGYAFTFTGHALHVSSENLLRNNGVIEDGTFVDASQAYGFAVRNEASGVIRGGTFNASIGNSGIIAGGRFYDDPSYEHGPYVSTSGGTITGGAFDCMVMGIGSGAIEGGTFDGYVNLMAGFTIKGGTFNEEVNSGNRSSNLGGTIEGGEFRGTVNNWGLIEDGAFHASVYNMSNNAGAGTIDGGTFHGYVANYEGAVISGGAYSDGGNNNSVQNDGTISGGEFNINVNNAGAIEGNSTFSAYVENRSAGTIEGGTFDDEVYNTGSIADGSFKKTVTVTEGGIIAGGAFASSSRVKSNDDGTITGGTFDGTVINGDVDWPGAVINGGTFTGVVKNHDTIAEETDADGNPTIPRFDAVVTNESDGVIAGGAFEGSVIQNDGVIAGGTFGVSGSVQSSGTISGGAFDGIVGNEATGTIKGSEADGPTFGGSVSNYGAIAGGTFLESGSVANRYTSSGPGAITGGVFLGTVSNDGIVSNATDGDGKATMPHFAGIVTNGRSGVISGGRFEHAVINRNGAFNAGAYPVKLSLTGLTIREFTETSALATGDSTGEDTDIGSYATFEKDSSESNLFTLAADKGYALPDTITLHRESPDSPELVAGDDYTYDAATGTLAIKKSAVTSPLYLAASGIPISDPEPGPNPDPNPDPAPVPDPEPRPDPKPAPPADLAPGPAAPGASTPEPPPSSATASTAAANGTSATALAATGDTALPQVAFGLALFSGCVLIVYAAQRRANRRNQL